MLNQNDDLCGDYEAECSNCGWTLKLREPYSVGYTVGAVLSRDPDYPTRNRCNKCKAYGTLKITKVPTRPEPEKPVGFWIDPRELSGS